MSKLNQKKPAAKPTVTAVAAKHNLDVGYSANGNLQFKKEPLQMLYELAVSTLFGKGTFYKSSDKLVQELRKHVRTAVDQRAFDYVANLAIHARTEMNIRTIPVVLVVEFAKALSDKRTPYQDKIKQIYGARTRFDQLSEVEVNHVSKLMQEADQFNYVNMRQLVTDVIQRADQITDLYAYALDAFGGKTKVPMAVKRGVADAFNKFGEYNFAKYDRDGSVKFRDVLRIVHPTAKNEKQGSIFDKIMKEQLETPYTWETELSANGQLAAAERKSDKVLWTELVKSGKIGYMALLRNLRNIAKADLDSEVIKAYVTNVISDPKRVAESKQLPYDFIEAYEIIKQFDARMSTAVSKAIDLSVTNLPPIGEKVWVIVDMSGSMGHDPAEYGAYAESLTNHSAMSTALLLAAMLLKASGESAQKLAVTLFGSNAKTLKGVDTNNSIVGIKQELLSHRKGSISGSTNFEAALDQKSQLGFEPDTIIVLTDGEVNRFPYRKVAHIAGKKVVKIAVNLSASTTTPMPTQEGWFSLAGWSSAMFKWIPAIREKESVVDKLSVPYLGLPKVEKQ